MNRYAIILALVAGQVWAAEGPLLFNSGDIIEPAAGTYSEAENSVTFTLCQQGKRDGCFSRAEITHPDGSKTVCKQNKCVHTPKRTAPTGPCVPYAGATGRFAWSCTCSGPGGSLLCDDFKDIKDDAVISITNNWTFIAVSKDGKVEHLIQNLSEASCQRVYDAIVQPSCSETLGTLGYRSKVCAQNRFYYAECLR